MDPEQPSDTTTGMSPISSPVPSSVIESLTKNDEPAPVQDAKYFFEDGDCVFLASGVLFKLHKFNLCRDRNSMFANMFTDAGGVAAAQTEQEVIRLDDAAEDFRALCWAIYATGEYIKTCAEGELEYMMGLADRCSTSAPSLLQMLEVGWFERIHQGAVTYNHALTVAEFYDRREFQGKIYLELREKLRSGPPIATLHGLSKLDLTHQRRDRLVLGMALLSNIFNHATSSEHILPIEACANHQQCQAHWNRYCRSNDNDEPLKRLNRVKDALQGSSPLCLVPHLTSIGITAHTQVADFFLGPPPVEL
ncbi:BTB domain-containing protein [Mycena indigotica]|uniref:BTB domain-containing protein n=1 Tax=Mycena indigotica TaxID=2126181 RepID=A0A8H6VYN4_9AGAR|nr:BTB domain-containing protein [Mycena indigotica]KAF7298652.1 BTB domain-containing protein [Mycena indigotica]